MPRLPNTISGAPRRTWQGHSNTLCLTPLRFTSESRDQTLAAGNAGVEEIALEHRVMLRRHVDDDNRIFRPLGFVDRRGIGENELVQFAKEIGHVAAVEANCDLAELRVDRGDEAEIAVIDVFVVVVLGLHHLVADKEGRSKLHDLRFGPWVEGLLQLDIQGPGAETASVHRAEDLNVAD